MVLEFLLSALVAFTFIAAAVYVGVLRALDVFFDPEQDSIFLSDDSDPPEPR